MSWRTTGILFLILLVVAGVVFWQSRQSAEETAALPTASAPTQQTQPVSLFPTVELAQVARVDVSEGTGQLLASFTQDTDRTWFMTVPTSTQVLSTTVSTSVTGLMNATSRRTLLADENPLSAYGLDNPLYTITIAVDRETDTALYRVQVGDTVPSGDAYYMLKAGDARILVVPKLAVDNILNLVEQPPVVTPTPQVTLPLTGTVPITGTAPLSTTATPVP
jgi:hypothetical protein